jgi:hypothetical protein
MDIKINLIEAEPINAKIENYSQLIEVSEAKQPINVKLLETEKILISSEVKNIAEILVNTLSYISNYISLFAKNTEGELMPVFDYFLDIGLFEINSNGEIQPIIGNRRDIMFELINDEITPRI